MNTDSQITLFQVGPAQPVFDSSCVGGAVFKEDCEKISFTPPSLLFHTRVIN